MKNFVCMNCKYAFKSEENREIKNCPYCGEKKVIEEPSAQELIGALE